MANGLLERFLPANRHGIAIDVACILLNLFLFPFFNSRVGQLFDRSFADEDSAVRTLSFLMLLMVGFRLGGLYLKRFGIQARFDGNDDAHFPQYFLIFNVPIILLTSAFAVIYCQMILIDLGLIARQTLNSPIFFGTGLVFLIAAIGFEIWLLYRLRKPLNDREKALLHSNHPLFSPKTELMADFGLFIYLMIWQVFYNQIVALFLFPDIPGKISSTEQIQFFFVSLFVFLIPSFFMFYISPRTVFMVEDRKDKILWITIPLAFISSIIPHFVIRVFR